MATHIGTYCDNNSNDSQCSDRYLRLYLGYKSLTVDVICWLSTRSRRGDTKLSKTNE